MDTAETIIERFRAAAIGMGAWEDALAAMAVVVRARAGQIALLDHHGTMTLNIMSGVSAEEGEAYYRLGGPDPARNIRNRAFLAAQPLRCRTEEDFATPEHIATSPIYRELFEPYDFLHSCMVRLHEPGEAPAALALLRPRTRGHAGTYERRVIEAIAPAIAGATRTALHLSRDRDAAILSTAETLAGPTILLAEGLRILSLSPAAEAMVRSGTWLTIRAGRLMAADPASHAALERAFAATCVPEATGRRNTLLTLRGQPNGVAVAAEMAPLPHRPAGPMAQARAMLMFRTPAASPPRDLRTLFGLTAAEATVAALLVDGHDTAEIADLRRTALTTVRNQVKALLAKTDSRRQAELVLKLRGG